MRTIYVDKKSKLRKVGIALSGVCVVSVVMLAIEVMMVFA